MKDWTNYQEKTYNNSVCNLLVEFLDNYKISSCIDLGCGSGNETVYMLKKGIKVLSVDRQLNKNFILNRLTDLEKTRVSFMESNFENLKLPKTDLIVAIFSIPFCNPKYFDNLWEKIYDSINVNGYFVGQLLGDRDAWKDTPNINTFSIEQVNEYLKKYQIIKLHEIEHIKKSNNKKWHFYDIIAKKESENS